MLYLKLKEISNLQKHDVFRNHIQFWSFCNTLRDDGVGYGSVNLSQLKKRYL